MVIPRFVQQALRGDAITVYGDGTQTRCFADVSDVVTALIGLMREPRAEGEVFNVGNDKEISIADLACLVREITGSHSEIALVPFEKAYNKDFEDLARRVPDLTKVRRLIGYKPQVDTEGIVRRVVEYYRART